MPAGNPANPHKCRETPISSRIRFSHPLLGRGLKALINAVFSAFLFLYNRPV
jgi:hypothetical protein